MKMKNVLIILALVLFACTTSVYAAPVLLYDVDFNADTVGSAPATGAGPVTNSTPSSISIFDGGAVTVVSAFGPLNNKPAELEVFDLNPANPPLGGVNLNFDLTGAGYSGFDSYEAQVDVVIDSLAGTKGLGIFFDNSPIHSVRFENNGEIRAVSSIDNVLIGTFSSNTLYTVGLQFDVLNSQWTALLNGTSLFTGSVTGTGLNDFRIAMTGDNISSRYAYVDNITVTAQNVPEPSTLLLLGGGLAGLAVVRRKFKV